MFFVALRVVAPAVDQSSTHDVDAARSRLVVDLNAVAVARWSFDADVPTCRAAVASTTTFLTSFVADLSGPSRVAVTSSFTTVPFRRFGRLSPLLARCPRVVLDHRRRQLRSQCSAGTVTDAGCGPLIP